MLFDHRAQTLPGERLSDQVDCSVYSGMLEIGVIPLDNLLLNVFWNPDEIVECHDFTTVDNFSKCPIVRVKIALESN